MLEIPYGTCYSKTKEEQLPTSGCPHKQWLEKSTLVTRSKLGWFFYALKHYLINVNTNVSNARMNIPKFGIDGTNEKIRLGKLMGKDFIITSF